MASNGVAEIRFPCSILCRFLPHNIPHPYNTIQSALQQNHAKFSNYSIAVVFVIPYDHGITQERMEVQYCSMQTRGLTIRHSHQG